MLLLIIISIIDWSYAQKLVTVRLAGVLKLLEPVFELNLLNDFGQAIGAAEFSPLLLRRHHKFEYHGQGRFAAQAALGLAVPVPHGGEGARSLYVTASVPLIVLCHFAVLLFPTVIVLFSHTDLTDRVNPGHTLPH